MSDHQAEEPPMNPTNQSKQEELRQQIAEALSLETLVSNGKLQWFRRHYYETGHQGGILEHTNAEEELDQLVQLIQAHDEAREREIRIDELSRMRTRIMDDPNDDTNIFWYRTYTMPEFEQRITQLTTHPNEHGESNATTDR